MTRVSLVEAYDNKDVIKQISDLKDAVGNLDTESVTGIVNDVNTLKTQMSNVNNTVQTQGQSISQVKGNNVTQVTLSENLGSITSALSKQDGTVLTSQPVNLKQVKTAVLVPGSSPNIFRLSLTLSDDSVIESNDLELELATVEGQDIYMTAVELIEDSASHKLQVKVTRSDGSTVLSNNVTYDYPSVADAVTEGLVKSSSAEGNVTVNADATMTVNGFDTVKTRITALENADEQMRTNVSNISADVETVEGSVTTLSETVTGLSETVASTDGRITQNTTDITQLKTDVSTNTTNLTTIRGDVTTLKANVNAMSPAVSQNTADIGTLRTDVDDNAADISALEADMIGKVSTFQGTEYEGKILKVDATGNLVLADPSKSAAPSGLVSFFDWNGRLLHEYTSEEFLALGEMPALPEDNELVHYQEWNWDWEHAVAEVNANQGWLDVGATCCSADGYNHLFVLIRANAVVNVDTQWATTGFVDWGDGNISNYESVESANHTYESSGLYHIKTDLGVPSIGYSGNKRLLSVYGPQSVRSLTSSNDAVINVISKEIENVPFNYAGVMPRSSTVCASVKSYNASVPSQSHNSGPFTMSDRITAFVSSKYNGDFTVSDVNRVIAPPTANVTATSGLGVEMNGELIGSVLGKRGTSVKTTLSPQPKLIGFKVAGNFNCINSVSIMRDSRDQPRLNCKESYLNIAPLNSTETMYYTYNARGLIKILNGSVKIPLYPYDSSDSILFDCTACTTVPTPMFSEYITNDTTLVISDELYDEWIATVGWDAIASHCVKQSEYKGILRIPILSDLLEDENF